MAISLKHMDQFDHNDVDAARIGGTLKTAREALGYSVEDLAVTCGLANAEINDIEAGVDADPQRLKRIAAALQISVESLTGPQA